MIPWYSVVYCSPTAKQSTFYKNHGGRFIFAISSALYNSMLFDLGTGNSSTKLLWVWFSSHSRRVDTLLTTSLVRCFLTQTSLCRLLENRLKSENCFNCQDNWKDWFKEAFPHKFACDVLKLFPGVIRSIRHKQSVQKNSSHKSSLHLSFSWPNSVTNEVIRT